MDKGIALEYNKEAPKIIAKARGEFLNKMLEIAETKGITVYRDPDLTEVLFKLNEGAYIPEDLFTAVAAVMVYCYNVNSDFRSKFIGQIDND